MLILQDDFKRSPKHTSDNAVGRTNFYSFNEAKRCQVFAHRVWRQKGAMLPPLLCVLVSSHWNMSKPYSPAFFYRMAPENESSQSQGGVAPVS